MYQAQHTATASAQHGRVLTSLFAKSIGTPQVDIDAMMASIPVVQDAAPPPTLLVFLQVSEDSSDEG